MCTGDSSGGLGGGDYSTGSGGGSSDLVNRSVLGGKNTLLTSFLAQPMKPADTAAAAFQALLTPDLKAYKKSRKDASGTLLTGPSGIDISAQNIGRTTLMGG